MVSGLCRDKEMTCSCLDREGSCSRKGYGVACSEDGNMAGCLGVFTASASESLGKLPKLSLMTPVYLHSLTQVGMRGVTPVILPHAIR